MAKLKASGVPPGLVDTFVEMEKKINDFFSEIKPVPEEGRIFINGTRFMWSQSKGLAMTFRDTITDIYGERGAEQILYKFGQSLGASEAKMFHERFKLTVPIERLAAGPIYFAYTGWAFVEILPASNPEESEDYLLTYRHPNSFEAEAMEKEGRSVNHPICFINAGYSSGWCGESFNLPPEAKELTCEAKGDSGCVFIMTHRNKMLERERKYKELLKTKKPAEITTQEIL